MWDENRMNLDLPAWSIAPFVLLLLAIAVLPLAAPHWWHSNRNRALVALGFAVPVALYLLYVQGATGQDTLHPLLHELKNYVSFILLLGSLYVVSGGIVVAGDLQGRPLTNTLILAVGAVLARDVAHALPLHFLGLLNLPLLAGIIAGVLLQGVLAEPYGEPVGGALMLAMALLSLRFTPRRLREANGFTWGPILEVAILFLGIFITMVPALEILGAHGKEFGVTEPWQFFWLTGGLSSFLDNAPTYLTFATLAAGSGEFARLVNDGVPGLSGPLVLQAISC